MRASHRKMLHLPSAVCKPGCVDQTLSPLSAVARSTQQSARSAAPPAPSATFSPLTHSQPQPLLNSPRSINCLACSSRHLSTIPFYGAPLPPSSRYSPPNSNHVNAAQNETHELRQQKQQQYYQMTNLTPLSPLQRVVTLIHSSLTALNDPTRADAVAAVGEVTGSYALAKLRNKMERDSIGARILRERPLVDEHIANRAFELLRQHELTTTKHEPRISDNTKITFGAQYATFLQSHGYHPNERDPIKFISDSNLAYVMIRYRQCHDYWHALTGLPPSVLGELVLKWVELFQTGLPLAAFSAMSTLPPSFGNAASAAGVSGLTERDREILWNVYFPWAVRVGQQMKEAQLMNIYYEEELETDLDELRERIGIEVAPLVDDV